MFRWIPALTLLACSDAREAPIPKGPGQPLTLLYTGEMEGEIEPCG
jgi:hypothetical protein